MVAGNHDLPADIAAQLAALPGERDPAYFVYLQTVLLEVLVTARRQTVNPTLRGRADRIVFDRTGDPIRRAAFRHGKPLEGEQDEVEDEMKAIFWVAMLAPSFFEIRFNRAMKWCAQEAGRRLRGREGEKRLQREREHRAFRGQPGVDYPGGAGEDEYPALDVRRLLREGLETLPPRQAQALVLLYEDDLPIFSKFPDVVTVASTLASPERTVRRLVADGLAALGLWYEEQVRDD